MKLYEIWKHNKIIKSPYPGQYAGITTQKIFGRLSCGSGKRAKKENRIFFHTWEDAIEAGYRPCKNCKPEKIECDHMPFGLTGGWALSLTKLRKRIRVSCALCEKHLGYTREDERGNVRWKDGFILSHDALIEEMQ
ncbi:MAG: hypothetical protein HYY55_03805 [Candidatus Niyogibacteria bacterium]|nr:MAG: hypothetical protein HYY55_03805 [Candidatus Niyogibacteria bacterium]